MKTGIFLSYKGIGANLLHLSYCHQIAERFGPVTIITLCSKLDKILETDPKIKEVIYLDKYHKNISDILASSIRINHPQLSKPLSAQLTRFTHPAWCFFPHIT